MPHLGDRNTFHPNPNDEDDCNHDADPRSDKNKGQGSDPDHDGPDFSGGVSNITHGGNARIADLSLDELACVATFPKHICNLSFIQAL